MSFNRETLIQVFLYRKYRNGKFKCKIIFLGIISHGYYKRNSSSTTFGKIKATISKILDSPSGLETVIKWNFHGRTREVLECEKPPSRNVTFRTRNSRVIQLIAQLQNSEITILYLSPFLSTFTFPIPKRIYVFTLPQELIVFAIQPFDNCTCMRPSLQRMKNQGTKKKSKKDKEKERKGENNGNVEFEIAFYGRIITIPEFV